MRQKSEINYKKIAIFFTLACVLLVGFQATIVAAASSNIIKLLGGDRITVECDSQTGSRLLTNRLNKYSFDLNCVKKVGTTPTPTPTPTPSPTPTPTPTPTPGNLTSSQLWHAPGAHDGLNVHEHGDKPPVWADEFSMKNFGHPVYFGGDEATPNENQHKHQAYKGFTMTASGVDIYIRYHGMSNPHERSTPLHSYELYTRDSSGNVSFWQGWNFYGYPEQRNQRMTRRNEQPGYDDTNKITWPGRDQFIIAAPDQKDWDNYLRCEQWYGHGGLWAWDISLTICGASTLYTVDEHLGDVMNQATWKLTGSMGNSRRIEASHYGPENPRVRGENIPFDKWFCVKKQPNENRPAGAIPTWSISGAVTGPDKCESGWLPQYVASTFPKKGVYFETGNTAEKTLPVPGVTMPN